MRIPLVVVVVCCVANGALAWGPLTHMYVAHELTGEVWPEAVLAGAMPDLNQVARTPESKSALTTLTHYEFWRLPATPFAAGFASHNNAWGADHYIHCFFYGNETEYITQRMRILCDEFGLTNSQSEDVMEGVMDFLIRRDVGPEIGALVTRCADAFSDEEVDQLVAAYAQPLADRTALDLAGAEDELRYAAWRFSTVIWAYGQQLAVQSSEDIRSLLAMGYSSTLGVDIATANACMARAEELCWDWPVELRRIANVIRPELAALGHDWYVFKQPLPNGRAYAGQSCRFELDDSFLASAPSYHWKVREAGSGSVRGEGTSEPTLELGALTTADNGSLVWCEVDYGGSRYTSNTATLEVAEHLHFVRQPTGGPFNVGRPLRLTFVTEGGFPPLTYTWYKNGQPLPKASFEGEFYIPATAYSDSGDYRVEVYDSWLDTANSNTATISVCVDVHACKGLGCMTLTILLAGAGLFTTVGRTRYGAGS